MGFREMIKATQIQQCDPECRRTGRVMQCEDELRTPPPRHKSTRRALESQAERPEYKGVVMACGGCGRPSWLSTRGNLASVRGSVQLPSRENIKIRTSAGRPTQVVTKKKRPTTTRKNNVTAALSKCSHCSAQ